MLSFQVFMLSFCRQRRMDARMDRQTEEQL